MAYLSSVEVVQGIRTGLAQHGVDAAAAFVRAGLDALACGAEDALVLSDKLSQVTMDSAPPAGLCWHPCRTLSEEPRCRPSLVRAPPRVPLSS